VIVGATGHGEVERGAGLGEQRLPVGRAGDGPDDHLLRHLVTRESLVDEPDDVRRVHRPPGHGLDQRDHPLAEPFVGHTEDQAVLDLLLQQDDLLDLFGVLIVEEPRPMRVIVPSGFQRPQSPGMT
jgi:hypothetical protein